MNTKHITAHHTNPPQSPYQGKVVERARRSSPSATKSSSVLRCLRRCILDNRLRLVLRLPDSLRALGLGASPNTAPVYSAAKWTDDVGHMQTEAHSLQKLFYGLSQSTSRRRGTGEEGERCHCCPSAIFAEAVSNLATTQSPHKKQEKHARRFLGHSTGCDKHLFATLLQPINQAFHVGQVLGDPPRSSQLIQQVCLLDPMLSACDCDITCCANTTVLRLICSTRHTDEHQDWMARVANLQQVFFLYTRLTAAAFCNAIHLRQSSHGGPPQGRLASWWGLLGCPGPPTPGARGLWGHILS